MAVHPKSEENNELDIAIPSSKTDDSLIIAHRRLIVKFFVNLFLLLILAAIGFGAFKLGGRLHRLWTASKDIPRGPELTMQVFSLNGAACSLITTPTGQSILIDSGTKADEPDNLAEFLGTRRKIDLVILTSTKLRCIGGLEDLIDNDLIHGPILLPCTVARFRRSGRTAKDLLDDAFDHEIYVGACDQYLLSRNPPLNGSPSLLVAPIPVSSGSKWNSTMALRMEYGASSILYMEGLNSSEERRLVAENTNLTCDVLVLSGDQPNSAPLPELMSACAPLAITITCDPTDPPSDEAMRWFSASGARVGRTDFLGDFSIRLSLAPNQSVDWSVTKKQ